MKRLLLVLSTMISVLLGSAQDYNYLGTYTSDGTPEYLVESDVISQETLQMISDALPEGFPVPQYNPQYISSGYDTDIILEDVAEVWVTFVGEGAGYKNVLGFYTYDSSEAPPTTPDPEDITIVFPNVSALGSGGGLEVGNKVRIGQFSAGTGIGWVLLANGWKNKVTPGLWQLFSNPDYNPEADENLRFHNVLLSDPDNERIVLGFEDIRRDYSNCDNDFNDALFYITANPYTAIKVTNYNTITDHADVSSGNDGGLESNGDLARLIAKRNFDRNKSNTFKNTQKRQQKYNRKTYKSLNAKSGNLTALFPETGMFGTETTYVSSPEDLLAITNAENVFSIDYYEGENRVSAALAVETKGGVYNHTKTICDRLNNAQLLDVRTVALQGYKLVYTQLQRANGALEYALTFSVKDEGRSQRVFSLWNLDEYPIGDYTNFQVWGSTMGQVTTLVNHILTSLAEKKELNDYKAENILPTVFIKSGYYKQGKLHLNIVNKVRAGWLNIDGNYKATEQDKLTNWNKTIALNGAWEEEVTVDTGYLFDIGISILAENSYQFDTMYLADGPWGVDFNKAVDAVADFTVIAQEENETSISGHRVERGIVARGEVRETINIFRNLMAGDLQLNSEGYKNLQLKIKSDVPFEVSLVTDATDRWEERLRYVLDPETEGSLQHIPFKDFKNHEDRPMDFTRLKTIVFSVQGDYANYTPFNLEIFQVALTNDTREEVPKIGDVVWEALEMGEVVQSTPQGTVEEPLKIMGYPNPFVEYATITFPEATPNVKTILTNMAGRIVYQDTLSTLTDNRSIQLRVQHLSRGIYIYTLWDARNGKTYYGKLIKN
ncbi:DUF4114 domain-containing protein [Maribacter sp. 2304DJ31-5]|uniref:DUF4114 domain-containing protein n=1 Tax=Maribacter sp. 2304DJ31-5 TaxID=3386273 RepID=UPI0039BD92E1